MANAINSRIKKPKNPLGEGPASNTVAFSIESADPRVSEPISGKFYNRGDQRGHRQDYCQFVDSFLDGRTGQQPASDPPKKATSEPFVKNLSDLDRRSYPNQLSPVV